MNKVEEVFSGKICSRVERLYDGINDRTYAEDSLQVLREIESILREFREEVAKKDVDRTLGIQLATQYSKVADIYVRLEEYLQDLRDGKTPQMDVEKARKYASNLHLILNGFVDIAHEIDRGHKKQPAEYEEEGE
jgi:hypothetical protein